MPSVDGAHSTLTQNSRPLPTRWLLQATRTRTQNWPLCLGPLVTKRGLATLHIVLALRPSFSRHLVREGINGGRISRSWSRSQVGGAEASNKRLAPIGLIGLGGGRRPAAIDHAQFVGLRERVFVCFELVLPVLHQWRSAGGHKGKRANERMWWPRSASAASGRAFSSAGRSSSAARFNPARAPLALARSFPGSSCTPVASSRQCSL